MGAETLPESLNKRDILKAFGDRVLMEGQEKVEREYLDLDPDLTKQSLVPFDIADQYQKTKTSNCLSRNAEDKNSPLTKPLSIKLLKGEPNPMSMVITKVMSPAGESWDEGSVFVITILEGNMKGKSDREIINAKEAVANFRLHITDNTFSIPHRWVTPECRGPQNETGDRIGNVLLKVCEQIANSFANQDRETKVVEVVTAQLDVALWLNSNGYNLATQEDQNRFDEICNADEKLCVTDDLYIFPINVPEDQRNYQNRDKAHHVAFEKTFEPDSAEQEKESVVKNIRDRLK